MITRNLKPRSGRNCCDSNKDNAARTCKKLPVASFCASETAETGRIANGREQGDHVSRRQRRRKSTRSVPSRQGHRREAAKGFNWVRAKPPLRRAESRFGKPRCSLQRERVVTFCVVQKATKKHARTCKKLPVASFCASETAETGRIANGREQGDHVSRSRLRPATSIQSSAGNTFREAFQRHVPKPIFRTKRRRKGFESVRCSGVTA